MACRLLRPLPCLRPEHQLHCRNHHPHTSHNAHSTYTNGFNFDSQWRVFCRAQAPDATTFLTQTAEALPAGLQGSNPAVPSVKWPRLAPGVQVQIISAGQTVKPPSVYRTQAQAYNDTLASAPGQSEWVVCEGCTHGFPYEKPEFLAAQLVRLLERVP